MDKDRDLKRLMRSYDVPPARGDLAERIINAASGVPQKQGVLRWVRGVFEEFWSPAPAFCLALFLAVGFLAGMMTYGGADSDPDPDNIIEQLLNEEEGLL